MNDSPGGSLVHSLLDEAVAEAATSSAVRDRAGAWTYAELARWSRAVEAVLARRGVRKGDRVVLHLPTSRELVALFFGTSRRGAVFVPINPAMKKFQFDAVVDNADPVLVVTPDEFGPLWNEVERAAHTGERVEETEVHPDDIAVLVYTSGSTATPKGVIGPHRQVTFATRAIQAVLSYRGDDVVFCRFPMSWDYGLYKVLLSCAGRSEIVLADAESDLRLLSRMREVGATVVPIVPSLATMIATLAGRESGPAAPVRLFTNTGAALPGATIARLRAAFPGARVVRQFGQTECKRITIMPPDEDTERPGSSGLPLPGTSVHIVAADGTELPPGEIGEIVAAGPHVMPGYWRAPELSARAFRRDKATGGLRLHTGDYGRLDADGYLYFEGRRDDMFKRKGIRMSTLEIEAAAMDILGVRAAGAIPPSETRDLAICVESDLPPTTVLRELAKRLEPQKVPSLCHVVDEFPLTAHGKNATKELALLVEGARK
ncbi:AMP-binding protein [Amycolatopsis cynarae]|uniref:AMP-binding protein n=1 Tax=Amycolatopsis cynarae TaxID=2995223 RepID=A0ABY7B7L8_9PSEU|nr:AMP-binding protein [Amycolatopsis sp. HUAS 11-8]WAL67940.1 AMP-binding protein [Amycolatopsis sp. HUAS 11-8]